MGKKVHKELKKLTPKKKESKVGLYLQMIITLITIILAIVYFIRKDTLIYLQTSLAVAMFIMAYNNQKTYKRTAFTALYIGVGLFIIGVIVVGLLGW